MEPSSCNQEILSKFNDSKELSLLDEEIKNIIISEIKKTDKKVNEESLKELIDFCIHFKKEITDYKVYVNFFGDLTIEIFKGEKSKTICLFREGGNTVYCCKSGNKIIENECDLKDIIEGKEEGLNSVLKG